MRLALAPLFAALVILAASAPPTPAAEAAGASPGFLLYPLPEDLAADSGEPSLGVNLQSGNVFFQSGFTTLRASFDDASYPPAMTVDDVTPPFSLVNLDPYIWTDAATGRTWAGGIDHGCSLLGYTDDDGASWIPTADNCALPGWDHESFASGPWKGGAPAGAAYPRAMYYCAQDTAQVCAVSMDGGLTFRSAVVAPGYTSACAGHVFRVGVSQDGTAFAPLRDCGGKRGLGVSTNNGLTWTTRTIPGSSVDNGFDPAVLFTSAGRLVYAYAGANSHLYVTTSANPFAAGPTYSAPIDVSGQAGLASTIFSSIVSGDADRLAIAFLGTATPGNPFAASFKGSWDLYVAFSYDAGASWQVVKATTDPVQRGWICAGGIGCSGGRNLYDFIDAKVDQDGRVLVAFADGCIDACATPNGTIAQSTTALGVIARMSCGPSLYAAKGSIEGSSPCATGTMGGAGTPPPPPAAKPLHGTLYAHSVMPVENAGILDPSTLTPAPPQDVAPKVFVNAPGNTGANAGTVYDAHWFAAAPPGGYALSDQTVTAHVWIDAARVLPTSGTVVTVALYDANADTFAPVESALATTNVTLPLTGAPVEVIVTFEHVTATLGQGLELFVSFPDVAQGAILYDSTSFPTHVVIS